MNYETEKNFIKCKVLHIDSSRAIEIILIGAGRLPEEYLSLALMDEFKYGKWRGEQSEGISYEKK